jgi:hypothetical protein
MTPRRLSHNGNLTISLEEINALPLKAFKGKIEIVTSAEKLKPAFAEIKEHEVVGFDTETIPSFVRGQIHIV